MEDASRDDAHVEHRAALRDIRQQQIDERMLAVESRTSPVLECDDTLDCRQVALAERVVLLTKKTFPPLLCGPSSMADLLSRMGLVLIVVAWQTPGGRMSCWPCVPLVWGRPGSAAFVIPARHSCGVVANI